MENTQYPQHVRKFLSELVRRKAVSNDTFMDKTFINYLQSQKYDEDYITSMENDRAKRRKE